jgi:hypothetical protein
MHASRETRGGLRIALRTTTRVSRVRGTQLASTATHDCAVRKRASISLTTNSDRKVYTSVAKSNVARVRPASARGCGFRVVSSHALVLAIPSKAARSILLLSPSSLSSPLPLLSSPLRLPLEDIILFLHIPQIHILYKYIFK